MKKRYMLLVVMTALALTGCAKQEVQAPEAGKLNASVASTAAVKTEAKQETTEAPAQIVAERLKDPEVETQAGKPAPQTTAAQGVAPEELKENEENDGAPEEQMNAAAPTVPDGQAAQEEPRDDEPVEFEEAPAELLDDPAENVDPVELEEPEEDPEEVPELALVNPEEAEIAEDPRDEDVVEMNAADQNTEAVALELPPEGEDEGDPDVEIPEEPVELEPPEEQQPAEDEGDPDEVEFEAADPEEEQGIEAAALDEEEMEAVEAARLDEEDAADVEELEAAEIDLEEPDDEENSEVRAEEVPDDVEEMNVEVSDEAGFEDPEEEVEAEPVEEIEEVEALGDANEEMDLDGAEMDLDEPEDDMDDDTDAGAEEEIEEEPEEIDEAVADDAAEEDMDEAGEPDLDGAEMDLDEPEEEEDDGDWEEVEEPEEDMGASAPKGTAADKSVVDAYGYASDGSSNLSFEIVPGSAQSGDGYFTVDAVYSEPVTVPAGLEDGDTVEVVMNKITGETWHLTMTDGTLIPEEDPGREFYYYDNGGSTVTLYEDSDDRVDRPVYEGTLQIRNDATDEVSVEGSVDSVSSSDLDANGGWYNEVHFDDNGYVTRLVFVGD